MTGFIGGVIDSDVGHARLDSEQAVDVRRPVRKRNVLDALRQLKEGVINRPEEHSIYSFPGVIPGADDPGGFDFPRRVRLVFNKHLDASLKQLHNDSDRRLAEVWLNSRGNLTLAHCLIIERV